MQGSSVIRISKSVVRFVTVAISAIVLVGTTIQVAPVGAMTSMTGSHIGTSALSGPSNTRVPGGVSVTLPGPLHSVRAHFVHNSFIDCDVTRPSLTLVNFPTYAETQAEVCGIYSVEDEGISMYADIHGYPVGDPRIAEFGEPTIDGYIEYLLEGIATLESTDPSEMTTDEKGAYDWLAALDSEFEVLSAQDALNEYNKWNTQGCTYKPPNTTIFTYNPKDQSACTPTSSGELSGLFSGLTPPSYNEFIAYGIYDADHTLDLNNPIDSSPDQQIFDDGVIAGVGSAATIIAGSAPQILSELGVGDSAFESFLDAIHPFATRTLERAQTKLKIRNKIGQQAKTAQQNEELEQNDEPPDEELVSLDEGNGLELPEAGIDVESAAEVGADSLSGAFAIVTIAITIAIIEGIKVITASEIPGQLKSNLTSAKSVSAGKEVGDLLNDATGAGYVVNLQNFENQLSLSPIAIGRPYQAVSCTSCVVYTTIPQPPAGKADEIHVTALYPNGTPSTWTWTTPTVPRIDTWPLGVDDGWDGPPEVTVGIENGVVWTKQNPASAHSDATASGLQGFLPSGTFNYFNAAGKPETAFIDGNQFATLTSQGSIDAGGEDQGDNCATTGECTLSNSIIVFGLGGTAQLQDHLEGTTILGQTCTKNDPGTVDCLSDNLLPDGDLVPLGGSTSLTQTGKITQTGTGQLFRLTLRPDAGTPAGTWILNSSGTFANDVPDGPPDGGDIADQTVRMMDPSANAFGLSTTYTWQIEKKCAYNASTPPSTSQGVTVCATTPTYHSILGLSADDQDLTTCTLTPTSRCSKSTPSGWKEDPDFHGDPVATLTGTTITWTWTTPGTYHVRLITTDQDGAQSVSDQTIAVSAPNRTGVALSYTAATGTQPVAQGYSTFGPVQPGDPVTVTGCLSSTLFEISGDFSTPKVTVNWGDTSSDTGSAGGSTDANLSFVHDPGGSCGSPWQFSATHTYTNTITTIPFVQKPVTITVKDVTIPATTPTSIPPNTSTSSSVTVYADVYRVDSAPTFVSGGTTSTPVTAGSFATYVGHVTAVPPATISDTPLTGITRLGTRCTAGLPSGVTFETLGVNDFQITGAARVTAFGCYAIKITASNTKGSSTQTFVLEENAAPSITSSNTTAMTAGSTGSFNFSATGFPDPSWKVGRVTCTPSCPSALPADLAFTDNGNGTATLTSGGADIAAADTGTYSISVSASNSSGTTPQSFTLVIGGPPHFTSSAEAGFFTQSSGGFTITTAGYPAAALSCTIHDGTTTTTCTTNLGYTLIDSNFSQYGLYFATEGNGTANLGGAPNSAGEYTVTITAKNSIAAVTQTLHIYVSNTGGTTLTFAHSGPLSINDSPTGQTPAYAQATFSVGTAATITICSNDPTDTLSVDGSLPAGLSLTNGAGTGCPGGDGSAIISGTPKASLSSGTRGTFTDRIVDGANGLALLDIVLDGPPAFTSPSSATFTLGTSGSFTLSQGSLHTGAPGCFSSATLPTGLTFITWANNTATISGIPTRSGQTHVKVTASDCHGTSAQRTLTIDVVNAAKFTSKASSGVRVGSGGSIPITTNIDAYPTPTLSVTGTLPSGVTFTTDGSGDATLAVAADAPATATSAVFRIVATSSAGTVTQTFTLAIGTPTTFTTPSTPNPTATMSEGVNSSFSFATTGDPSAIFTCTVGGSVCGPGNLPSGLTFTDNHDGTAELSGTPTSAGSTNVIVTSTNGIGTPASVDVTVNVDTAPAFSGTSTDESCTGVSTSDTTTTIEVGATSTWTMCASGQPTPKMALTAITCDLAPVALPSGLTFTDEGGGIAQISGTAPPGAGAACPSGYAIVLSMANGATTVTQTLTLHIVEAIIATSAPEHPTFVPGAPNSYKITADAVPEPSFTVSGTTPLPTWLTLSSNTNGSATLSGTPPINTAGSTVHLIVDEANGVAQTLAEPVTLSIASFGLINASPPDPSIGQPYSYTFTTSEPSVKFSLPAGSILPAGLSLASTGTLSGLPTELGRFPVALTLTLGGTSVTTSTISLVVDAGHHALEISRFRTFGPNGFGDWFVQVQNTTAATIPLAGWDVGVQPYGSTTPLLIPIGTASLAPGGTAIVSGPSYSLGASFPTSTLGPSMLALPGGFEVVAPNGIPTDVAGETGALSTFFAGTGAAFPATIHSSIEDAFVRHSATGSPVDTDDNASDFSYVDTLPAPASTVTMTATPNPVAVGSTVQLSAHVTSATAPVSSGTVTFSATTAPIAGCDDLSLTTGNASCSFVFTTTGATSIVATFSGSTFAASARSAAVSLRIPGSTNASGVSGYWAAGSDGGIFSFGDAAYYGSMGGKHLDAPIVSMAATPDGRGYWLVASDGGIFSFGDATYVGSMGGKHLDAPIVGMAATPDGRGYWLVASDGGTFSFGDATYVGSMGGKHLDAPIVGIAATPDAGGYWLVASDGGIFSFGDATYVGSMGAKPLNAPIVGIAATPDGRGYWLVASDGGIFSFGDATYVGSMGAKHLDAPIVGIAATPDGRGYWLVASDGGIFSFGDARTFGSLPGLGVKVDNVVTIAPA